MADAASRAGTSYATPPILDYLAGLHAPMDPALAQAFDAPHRHGLPAIQVGPHEGSFLGWIARSTGARRVVEVGTLAGFSAIHLARALPADGVLYTCERDPAHAAVAAANLAAAGLSDRAHIALGDATTTLGSLAPHAPFDLVFLDADKGRYDVYAAWAAAHLRPGGLLIADNVFFFGRLLSDEPDAVAMRRFHELAARRFDSVVVPTPDGMLLGRLREAA
jgi:caffeoyl-CoA O-methyltransferase